MDIQNTLGQVSAVIGAQWGDEGKGKITDWLAEHFDVIARSAGGANAGHTILVNGQKHVFHLLPSGCLYPDKPVYLGAGMVIHLPTLMEEIALLEESGINIISRLHISGAAHVVFDYHMAIDAALEQMRADDGSEQLGTTKRGIGPAYMDKAARTGIRIEHLLFEDDWLRGDLEWRSSVLQYRYGVDVDIEQEIANVASAKEVLQHCTTPDFVGDLYQHYLDEQTILIEGAQATLLDIDHGTYPYVTSSSTTAAGALQGLGLPPLALSSTVGVAKAYCTRVGSGPFLTEATQELSQELRDKGGEYGATTGRPRRCGWLHIPDIIYAGMINGFTVLNVTKLDVLDSFEVIPVGVGIDEDGSVIYEELAGWQSSTQGITNQAELPKEAQAYLDFIAENTGIPVGFIGTGPERGDMIVSDVFTNE